MASGVGSVSNGNGVLQRARSDTEFAQSLVRFALGTAVLAYLTQIPPSDAYPISRFFHDNMARNLAAIYAVAFAHSLWVYLRPGENLLRRIMAMSYDYGILGLIMMTSGEITLPLFPAVVWVTLGNGVRYGRRYLGIAVGIALTVLSLVWINNPYWRAHPFLAASLLITVAIIPIYAVSLLSRIRAANDAAEEASLAKSRFLAQASHDLRHPLHALNLLSTQLAQTGLTSQQHDLVRKIDLSAHTATGMLNAFLDVSIIETGRLRVRMAAVDVGQMLTELQAIYSVSAAAAHVTIRMPQTRVRIAADAAILRTIVQNLMSNVIKHAPRSQLLVGVRRRSGAVWLEVHDTGPGIDAEREVLVIDQQVTPPSAGLGLSIVRDLARLCDLDFNLTPGVKRGTVARIGPFAEAVAHLVEAPPVRALSGLSVVVGPDHTTLAETLQRWGCDVATSVADAPRPCVLITNGADVDAIPKASAVIQLGGHPSSSRGGSTPYFQLAEPVNLAELRSILMAIKSGQH